MLQIGITGGIGSGKSTVCQYFKALGIPIYYADARAKWLMTEDARLISQIKAMFGEEAYNREGQLNRAYIAGIVFNDPEKLKTLNSLIHPAVARDQEAWHQAQKKVPYTLKEAALIYESGSNQALDKVIMVYAPVQTRIERVMSRDNVSREAVESRISKQWSEEKKLHLADFIILNDGNQDLETQVALIHQAIKTLNEEIQAK